MATQFSAVVVAENGPSPTFV